MLKERRGASLCVIMAALVSGGCGSTNVTMPIFFPQSTNQMTVTAHLRSTLVVLHPSSKCMLELPPDRTRLRAGESWKGQIEVSQHGSCYQENARFSLSFKDRHGHSATGTWERAWSTGKWDLKKVQLSLCIVPNNGDVLNVGVVNARRRC